MIPQVHQLKIQTNPMPMIRVSLRKGKSSAYKRAILDQVYAAMREAFNVPEKDRFMVTDEHDEENLV